MYSPMLFTDLIRHSLVSSAIATAPRSGYVILDTLLLTLLPLLLCWLTSEVFKSGKVYLTQLKVLLFPTSTPTSLYSFTWVIHSTNESVSNSADDDDFWSRSKKQMHQSTTTGAHHGLVINGILNELCKLGVVNQSRDQTLALIPPEQWKSTREKYVNLQMVLFPTAPIVYNGMQFTYSVKPLKSDEELDLGKTKAESAPNKLNCSLTICFNDHDKVKKFVDKCKITEIDRVIPDLKEDTASQRYMYILRDAKSLMFARIPFNTSKTFNSIFFSQKQQAMKLIEDFEQRTGPWDPRLERTHKLIVLLHGRPGAGKTSTIKALAKHLDRDVFSVNPGVCRNDADLFHTMHDKQTYYTDKRYGNAFLSSIPLKKRLVVMEDLDCSGCDWLLHRDADKLLKSGAWQSKMIIDGDAVDPTAINTVQKTDKDAKATDASVDKEEGPMASISSSTYRAQTTTFSGFLNVLDGLAELDGLVIIITTNNLDKFDPAFIRPGRVDMLIKLDAIGSEEARDMLNFRYYPELVNSDQYTRLSIAISRNEIAPCKVEECCQYAKSIDDAITCIDQIQDAEISAKTSDINGAKAVEDESQVVDAVLE